MVQSSTGFKSDQSDMYTRVLKAAEACNDSEMLFRLHEFIMEILLLSRLIIIEPKTVILNIFLSTGLTQNQVAGKLMIVIDVQLYN